MCSTTRRERRFPTLLFVTDVRSKALSFVVASGCCWALCTASYAAGASSSLDSFVEGPSSYANAAAVAATTVDEAEEYPELFEGPEKTLSLRFEAGAISARSLRLIPQSSWEEILKFAKCEILSVINSSPLPLPPHNASDARNASSPRPPPGLTGYLLSESSLFLSDTTLTLKTCGRTTPLLALEPILDLVVPGWKGAARPDRYLKYASFMRLGYMRPDEQVEPHTSWEQEVEHMDKYFQGESVVLGSEATSKQHVYVANYLAEGEVVDTVSTQVAFTNLDTDESLHRYGGGEAGLSEDVDRAPLATAWPALHGRDRRSLNATFDEKFFDPIGYSSNAVSGRHFTTVHITPQPGCSYLSVETSLPMGTKAKHRFIRGAQLLGRAGTAAVTEFAMSPLLIEGAAAAPEIPGFELRRSTRTNGVGFSVAHHHYERLRPPTPQVLSTTTASPPPAPYVAHGEVDAAAVPDEDGEEREDWESLCTANQ